MLFPQEQAYQYIVKIENSLKYIDLKESNYVREMLGQLIHALRDGNKISLSDDVDKLCKEAWKVISKELNSSNLSLASIEVAHFEFAKLLRALAVNGHYSLNQAPILQFYLAKKFDEISQSKVDEIRFEIPAGFLLSKFDQKTEELDLYLLKLTEWEERQEELDAHVREKIEKWSQRLSDSEGRYKSVIEGHNYLGLAHAFKKMIDKKTQEAAGLRVVMIVLAALTLVIPIMQMVWGGKFQSISDATAAVVSTTVFSIAAEMVLIYYFRLCYIRWSNVKNQVAQLELRHSMCAFVQDYANKSKELDRDTLMKFENMIFTEVSDSAPPPNIYDAVDSIAKLLAAWKKPGA
jgi:hypothetical protein